MPRVEEVKVVVLKPLETKKIVKLAGKEDVVDLVEFVRELIEEAYNLGMSEG